MPDRLDEMSVSAHALVNDAHDLRTAIDERRFHSAHQKAVRLRRAVRDLDRRLDAEWQAERDGVAPNPYRIVPVRAGDQGEALARLSDEDLLELARHSYWSSWHEPHPYSRWWKSKYVSLIRRELVARGHEHDAWMDGTEEEDA